MESSNVNIFAKSYETSQSVLISCIKTLIVRNKGTKTTPFFSHNDPNAVSFRLVIKLDVDGWLSLDIENLSSRIVQVERYSVLLFDHNDTLLKRGSCTDQILESSAVGTSIKFYKFRDDSMNNSIRIKVKVEYQGEPQIREEHSDSLPKTSLDLHSLRNLSTDLGSLWIKGTHTDITFTVQGQIIKAHKIILCTRSDYFQSMFHSGMVENESENIVIQDHDPILFKKILEFLYTDVPPEDIDEVAFDLLPLADKYLLDSLKHHCAKALKKSMHEGNIKEILILAHKYNCPSLKKDCFKELTFSVFDDWSEIKNHPDLPLEYLQYLSNRGDSCVSL